MSTRLPQLSQRRMIVLASLAGALVILFFPARDLVSQKSHINALETRLEELDAENERLEKQMSRLSDPSELSVQARERLGLVEPGERMYVVDAEKRKEEPTPAAVEDPSWWNGAWDWFVSLLRGGD